jgi:ABC-type uncharacterized transport system permease subunit
MMRYTSTMNQILLYLLAASLYLGLAAHAWSRRWQGPALNVPHLPAHGWQRLALLLALLVHAESLRMAMFDGGAMRFGFAIALSTMVWFALAFYWVESFFARMDGLQYIGLPIAAVSVTLPGLLQEQHLLINSSSSFFRIHLLVAMLAYSLFTLAALHALLMAVAEKRLHSGRISPFLAGLPPLLTMEALLFRLIHIAFFLLTVTVITGVMFSEELFGRALRFDHKTVFAILSWCMFAALLLGRHLRGWRGRIAVRWTLAGFLSLLLAYVGTRFVIEVLLGRVT